MSLRRREDGVFKRWIPRNPGEAASTSRLIPKISKPTMKQLSNVYFISALATIGGLIQGFDVSSMSAIIGTDQVILFYTTPDEIY